MPTRTAPSVSVRQAARASERFAMREQIRKECGFAHTYPGRQDDAARVLAFLEAYGVLPPRGIIRRLVFSLTRGVTRGEGGR